MPETTTNVGEFDRYVFIEKTKCPACHTPDLKTLRSQTYDDGTVSSERD